MPNNNNNNNNTCPLLPPVFETRGPPRVTQSMGYPPPLPEPLRCPRCDSDNTKFCYYNNYNMAQPRHHCKACRRYWTQGGSLRDIPVGGGIRRNNTNNNKKPKLSHQRHASGCGSGDSSSTALPPSSSLTHDTTTTTAAPTTEVEKFVLTSQQLVNLDRSIAAATNVGFSSLMMTNNNSAPGPGPVHGFLQGCGYRSRAPVENVGGFPFATVNKAAVSSGLDTWQIAAAGGGGDRELRSAWPETVVEEEKVANSSSTELPF